ncbi:T9SS type A sorting domain-containing protein [Aquimarina sp. MMG016]|uniref:T9SS type A sorting domain-containing protein n=1 Tax=Aquimarina sp. MMG016 TaxID=2822690 RepID=UPI001B3A24E4|nr:T9SS type A sorting domain-containing protein [Aquimarina sp. MMG016]MBQ4821577.1 T9SS type A sorting domain-containing protein [Aquimarina sp. MMG016]
MRLKYIIITVLVFVTGLNAQVTNEKEPYSWKEINKKNQKELSIIEMPKFNMAKIKSEDAINDLDKSKVYRFGYEFDVDYGFKNAGVWDQLSSGDWIWRIRFKSNGAKTLNFVCNEYKLPEGASLYLYSEDRKDLLGAYTDAFNRADGMLGTWMVEGDDIILEYYVPESKKGQGKFNISKVVHGYRSVTDFEISQKGLNDSGDCNQDVDCTVGADFDPLKNELKRSVALMVVGSSGFCTGTLINNTAENKAPYFLTANHCYVNESGDPLSNISTWAFRFNWASPNPSCATTTPSTNGTFDQTTSGATLLANNSKSDMLLVNIDTSLPDSWNLEWAGWDRTGNTPNFTVGIHHPSGDIMKVCRDNQSPAQTNLDFNGNATTEVWEIADWDLGVTERGSSGSALFDQNGRIIGQLAGGTAACNGTTDNNQFDVYGRFDISWDFGTTDATRLSNWLDPQNTGQTTLDMLSGDVVVPPPPPSPPGEDIVESILFPNPTQGEFTITNKEENLIKYTIYDIFGKSIDSGQSDEENPVIDITSQRAGMYFVYVEDLSKGISYTRRVVLNPRLF